MPVSPVPPVRPSTPKAQTYAMRTALMLVAMFFYAMGDSTAKALSERIDVSLVMMGQGFGGLLFFLPVAIWKGEMRHLPKLLAKPVLLRNTAEFVAPFSILLAMSITPLATIGALIQLQPLFVLALAALFLKEKVGFHRWASVVVGFASVLLILRPGTEGFSVWAIVAIFGVFWLAVRDVATRRIDPSVPTLLLTTASFAVQGSFGAILAVTTGVDRTPEPAHFAVLMLLIVAAGMAFTLTTIVLRSGDVAAVTPYRYSRLLYTLAISVVFFGESPDVWVLTGAAIITLSGLYAFWRERVGARAVASKSVG